jgi:hypothetical protein
MKINLEVLKVRNLQDHESDSKGLESAFRGRESLVKVPVYGKGGGATRFSKYTGNYKLKFR